MRWQDIRRSSLSGSYGCSGNQCVDVELYSALVDSTIHNRVMKAFNQKKRDEGKAHRTAVGAVCRKLCSQCFLY